MDKIVIMKDGKVIKEIEGKILYQSEEVGLLDITSTRYDTFKKRISDGIVTFKAHIDTNFSK
jgi:putative methionine-R-sulfoxide reductase with GAF domain